MAGWDCPPTVSEHPVTSTNAASIAAQGAHPVTVSGDGSMRAEAGGRVSTSRTLGVRYLQRMADGTVRVTTTSGTVEGVTRSGVTKWRSIRTPGRRWGAAVPGAAAGAAVARGALLPRVRLLRAAAPQVHRDGGRQVPADERGLPDAQRRRAGQPARRPLPVMVFIHGGGYILGSSATPLYDGAALARRGCVFVSVNYRLGALGCLDLSSLSTPDHRSRAICSCATWCSRWGGCATTSACSAVTADNVTIFGESAGAHAVATLLAVPAAKGLFAGRSSESPASGMVGPVRGARSPTSSPSSSVSTNARRARDAAGRGAGEGTRPADDPRVAGDAAGSFAVGPTVDGDYLPRDPVDAMRTVPPTRCRSSSAPTPTRGGCSPGGSNCCRPPSAMIERLLADIDPATRERIQSRLPGLSAPRAVRPAVR